MGNTYNGMTYVNIAQRGLMIFNKLLAPVVGLFTTDFSEEVAQQGEVVTTRVVPASAAAQDLQTDLSGDRESATSDTTTTAVSVTLNQNPIVKFHITDEEAAKIASGVWTDTKDKLIEKKINALGESVFNYVIRLMTAASFTNSATVDPASFDSDDVADIRGACSLLDWPRSGRGLVLDTSLATALSKDPAVKNREKSGLDVLISGQIAGNFQGFDRVIECPQIPPTGTVATEKLRGFACMSDAIAIAMRGTPSQAPDDLEAFEVLTDPTTGVILVYRAWHQRGKGIIHHSFETLFGASVAKGGSLLRLKLS